MERSTLHPNERSIEEIETYVKYVFNIALVGFYDFEGKLKFLEGNFKVFHFSMLSTILFSAREPSEANSK